jgi:hypothetical protein
MITWCMNIDLQQVFAIMTNDNFVYNLFFSQKEGLWLCSFQNINVFLWLWFFVCFELQYF